jgi:hypothetical protein
LLRVDPATAPHGGGVLMIHDSGDRKDGVKIAHWADVAGPVHWLPNVSREIIVMLDADL